MPKTLRRKLERGPQDDGVEASRWPLERLARLSCQFRLQKLVVLVVCVTAMRPEGLYAGRMTRGSIYGAVAGARHPRSGILAVPLAAVRIACEPKKAGPFPARAMR